MGGLITRYYLRYGTVDALEGDGDFPINMSGAEKVGTAVLGAARVRRSAAILCQCTKLH